MGEKGKLAEYPDDYLIYKLAYTLHKLPDEIRSMALDDLQWMLIIPTAEQAAACEMRRRATGDDESEKS